MKAFNRIFAAVILVLIVLFAVANIILAADVSGSGRPYRVEINRLAHVFESFWRGTNAEKIAGSGLGLYISRKLMRKMNGEIFAEIRGGYMYVTAVFAKV